MSRWIRVAEWAEARGKGFAILLASVITVPVVISDWMTGALPWSGAYLVPIALVAWVVGRRAALVYSVIIPVLLYTGFLWLDPNGKEDWLSPLQVPLRMLTFVTFTYLISALREALDRERAQVAELRELNAELDRFAVAASHDLQSPLGRIISFIDLVRDSPAFRAHEKEAHFLDRASASAHRMRDLVNDLLTFARIGPGRREFFITDLNQIAERVTEDLYERIREAGATVRSSNLPFAYVVPSEFYELFLNLVSNALRYRRPGVAPEIEIRGGSGHRSIWLEVEDNGQGIPEAERERIFEPFHRGSGAAGPGTGIGLTICRKVVSAHHGRISVTSRVGEGTVFRVEIPSEPPAPRGNAKERTPVAPHESSTLP